MAKRWLSIRIFKDCLPTLKVRSSKYVPWLTLCLLLHSSEVIAAPPKKLTFQQGGGYVRGVAPDARVVWAFNTGSKAIVGVERKGNDLFITTSKWLICLDPGNGRKKWKSRGAGDYSTFSQKAIVFQDVVLVSFWAGGAYLHCRTDAFDRSTGRLLWDHVGEVKRVDAAQVVLERRFPYPDPKPHDIVTTVLVERRTGKEIRVISKINEMQPTPGPMQASPFRK